MLVSRITINFWFRCSNWNKSNINIIFFQKHGTACTSWNRSDQLHVCGRCFDFHTTVRSHRSDILLNSSRPGSSPLLHFFFLFAFDIVASFWCISQDAFQRLFSHVWACAREKQKLVQSFALANTQKAFSICFQYTQQCSISFRFFNMRFC